VPVATINIFEARRATGMQATHLQSFLPGSGARVRAID
jgi:hypothetical protein